MRHFLVALSAILLVHSPLKAQLPSIRLDTVFPAGGRVGTTFEIQVGGVDFDEVKSLRFSRPGLKAEALGGNRFKVSIAPDAPPGILDVRAIGRHGISNPLAFHVSDSLTEVLQKTPNQMPEQAQKVTPGCVVNGRFPGGGDDFYAVPLKAGQRLLVECLAERLDSELDATLAVLSPDGREVAFNRDHFGRDPLVDFTADADGDYLIRLHDFYFRGGSSYRLLIGNRPVIDAIVPSVIEPGKTGEFTLIGRHLPGGRPLAGARHLEQLSVKLTAPLLPTLLDPVSSPSVDLRLLQHRVRGELGWSNPISLRLANGPLLLEKKPNDTLQTAQELPGDEAVVSGQMLTYRDSSWYRIRMRAKQTYFVSVIAEHLDGPGDFYVQAFDPKGKFLTEFDNYGKSLGGAYRPIQRDPYGSFTANEEGEYRLAVRDRTREGSPRHRYVLTVRRPRPDFTPLVCHNLTENLKAPRQLLAGASQALDVVIVRRDNFAGDVTCTVEGLPAFIQCPPTHIVGNQDRGVLVFTADRNAPPWEGAIRVKCTARIGDQVAERWATASVMTNNITEADKQLPSRLAAEICLAVRPGAPFALLAQPLAESVKKGDKLKVKVEVKRYAADFKGKVALTALQLPGGFSQPKMEIAAGQNEVMIELDVNAVAGTYTFTLRGEGQVMMVRDPKQAAKETTVALPCNLITVRVVDK